MRPSTPKADKSLNGQRGVYFVASEMCRNGVVPAVTSRNAFGADILAVSKRCIEQPYSVQVKTNTTGFSFWLMSDTAKEHVSDSLVYAFVNFRPRGTELYLVPSTVVAENMLMGKHDGKNNWPAFRRIDAEPYRDNWKIFSA